MPHMEHIKNALRIPNFIHAIYLLFISTNFFFAITKGSAPSGAKPYKNPIIPILPTIHAINPQAEKPNVDTSTT